MNLNLLVKLVHWLDANEKQEKKFRTASLIRLSKIETMLNEVLACQLAQLWPEGKLPKEKRDGNVQEVEDRISISSNDLGLKMVRYIYGESIELPLPRDERRKWTGWEI